jgi:hypothetical protein
MASAGYDPMHELFGALEEVTTLNTSGRAVAPVAAAGPAAAPVVASVRETPAAPPAPASRPKRPTGITQLPMFPQGTPVGRATTAQVPTAIYDGLQLRRLEREAQGRGFRIVSFFNAAIAALPTDGAELAHLLSASADELNIGRREGDDGWLPESRLALRVGESQERTVAQATLALWHYTGRRFQKRDLWAFAILNHLRSTH